MSDTSMNTPMPATPEVLRVVRGLNHFLRDELDSHLSPELAKKIRTFDSETSQLTEAEFRVAASLLMRYMRFLAE